MLSVVEQAKRSMFVSPGSRKPLYLQGDELITGDLSERYPIKESRAFFIPISSDAIRSSMADDYDAHRTRIAGIKRMLREKIFHVIKSNQMRLARSEFARRAKGQFVLGVGGGPLRAFDAINLNIGPYQNVEVVADAHALPYADGAVDHIWCQAVLEHLIRPDIAMQEMARVLKPGGYIFLDTPGLQPYHGYPHHYQNFTISGHDALAERFGIEKAHSGASIGPTSALVVLISEYLRQYIPAGSLLAVAFRVTLGLLLIQLDRIVAHRANAYVLAGSVFFMGRKRLNEVSSQ